MAQLPNWVTGRLRRAAGKLFSWTTPEVQQSITAAQDTKSQRRERESLMRKKSNPRKKIFIIISIVFFILVVVIIRLFSLFNAHPEIMIMETADLRAPPFFSKLLAQASIIKNKIVFSYFWDDVKKDLFINNPDLEKEVKLIIDIDYMGYGILLGGNGTIKDLSPFERINMPGLFYFEKSARFLPDSRLPGPDDRKFEIYLSEKRQRFKSHYYDRALAFWHSLDIELRMK